MRKTYIHNYARTLAGQMYLRSVDYRYCMSAPEIAQAIVKDRWAGVALNLVNVSKAVKARLAYAGAGTKGSSSTFADCVTMNEVHAGKEWLDPSYDGEGLVWIIAMTTLVAAMADNFWDECQGQRRTSEAFLRQQGVIDPVIKP